MLRLCTLKVRESINNEIKVKSVGHFLPVFAAARCATPAYFLIARLLPIRAKENFHLLFLFICLTTSYGQPQTQSLRTVDSLVNPAFRVSELEFFLGSGSVYWHGYETYRRDRVFKLGYSAGLALSKQLGSKLKISARFSYELKGCSLISDYLSQAYTPPMMVKSVSNINRNYFTMSILSTYPIVTSGRLLVGLGPYTAYLLSGKFKRELYVDGVLVAKSGGRSDPDQRFDFGIAGMTTYRLAFGDYRRGSVGLIYNHGLMDINGPMSVQIRNSALFLLLGITINRNSIHKQ
ncbi:MAG TPA: outer membrane beta-barrel protein [Chryseosolibacter sp.]